MTRARMRSKGGCALLEVRGLGLEDGDRAHGAHKARELDARSGSRTSDAGGGGTPIPILSCEYRVESPALAHYIPCSGRRRWGRSVWVNYFVRGVVCVVKRSGVEVGERGAAAQDDKLRHAGVEGQTAEDGGG
ncbi:hypothetical protein DFH09DRAFT_1082554 [Mycena vulgaris]|nr:hypothetical protein DFH09DRAFT_1082554 [Mycena vulgaris]